MGLSGQSKIQGFNFSAFRNDTESFKSDSDKAFTNISLGLGFSITIINVITMVFLFRHKKCVGGIVFWQQLLFLCCTDILSGIAVLLCPLGYFFIHVHSYIYYSLCVTGIFLFPLSITLSAGNCFIISVLRYIYVKNIDKPNTIWHKRAVSWMILGNAFISIITFVSSVIVITVRFGFHYEEFCDMVNMSGQNEYKSKYIQGTLIILVSFLICTNISTILSIKKVHDMNRIQPARDSSLTVTSISNSQSVRDRNRYATTTFIAIVFALNITSLPSLLFVIVSINSDTDIAAETTEIVSRLMSMNSLINPFIYSLRTSNFREAIWRDLKEVWKRLRCARDIL